MPDTRPRKRLGRPSKAFEAKSRSVTVTLLPAELEQLEQLRRRVNEGLPAPVPRAALVRLGFQQLAAMHAEMIRAALARQPPR